MSKQEERVPSIPVSAAKQLYLLSWQLLREQLSADCHAQREILLDACRRMAGLCEQHESSIPTTAIEELAGWIDEELKGALADFSKPKEREQKGFERAAIETLVSIGVWFQLLADLNELWLGLSPWNGRAVSQEPSSLSAIAPPLAMTILSTVSFLRNLSSGFSDVYGAAELPKQEEGCTPVLNIGERLENLFNGMLDALSSKNDRVPTVVPTEVMQWLGREIERDMGPVSRAIHAGSSRFLPYSLMCLGLWAWLLQDLERLCKKEDST